MRLTGPKPKTPGKKRLIRTLTLCMVFTLLSSLAFSFWFMMMRRYKGVINYEDIELVQFEEPQKGDKIAVMHTTAGDMTFKLYPEIAPKSVANFCELAESGYYDGTYIFRVEQDVFFAGGSADAEGNLPQGKAGTAQERVPQELSPKLWPFRGALCSLTTGTERSFFKALVGRQDVYCGSRFLVANSIEMTEEIQDGLREDESEGAQIIAEAFIEHGGIPNYSQQITVFGQLIEGWEILEAITGAELVGEVDDQRPKEDIIITAVEIGTFETAE